MWILALLGCDPLGEGPRTALAAVDAAHRSGDLAAFEQVVVLEEVAPEVVRVCARLGVRQALDARELRPPARFEVPREILLPVVDLAIASQLSDEEAVAAFRDGFSSREVCPEARFGVQEGELTRLGARHWRVVHADGWVVHVEKLEDWRVTHVDGDPLVHRYDDQPDAHAYARAGALAEGLADGVPHADWLAVEHYLARHPERTDLAATLAALRAELEAAPPLLPTGPTGALVRTTVVPTRHLATELQLDAPARDVAVRFARGDEATVVRTGPLGAGRWRVTTPAGGLPWADPEDVDAVVTRVERPDGAVERHPAVVAGAWPDERGAMATVQAL